MKPKLLFILTRCPYPATDGTREKILSEIKALNDDFRVSILVISDETVTTQSKDYLKSILSGEIFIFKISKISCYIRSFLGLMSHNPMQCMYFYNQKAQSWLKIHNTKYNTICFHTIRLGQYLKYLKSNSCKSSSRLLLAYNDAISLNYEKAVKKARGLWRLIYSIEKNRVKNYEVQMLGIADKCSIITERDKKHIEINWKELRKNEEIPEIQVIQLWIADTFFKYNYNPKNSNLVFIGNLFYPPNRQGLEFFCKNIWQKIINLKPQTKLLIIGRGGKEFFSNIPNTDILGFVDNPYELIAEQALFVSPADFGAGISSKSLLAMALGLPIVSTKNSADGIEGLIDEKNICLIDYNNCNAAVDKIINLLENIEKRKKIGLESKILAKKNHSQLTNYPKLKSFIEG